MTSINNAVGATVYVETTFDLLARVEVDGRNALQADFTTIVLNAWNVKTPNTKLVNNLALTIGSVIFDTLQEDGRWSTDPTGYNFRYSVGDSVITEAGDYQFVVTYTTSGGKIEHSVFPVKAVTLTGT